MRCINRRFTYLPTSRSKWCLILEMSVGFHSYSQSSAVRQQVTEATNRVVGTSHSMSGMKLGRQETLLMGRVLKTVSICATPVCYQPRKFPQNPFAAFFRKSRSHITYTDINHIFPFILGCKSVPKAVWKSAVTVSLTMGYCAVAVYKIVNIQTVCLWQS